MTHIIIGLGNPGNEYENTRHNVGMMALEAFRARETFPEAEEKKKYRSCVSEGVVGKEKTLLLFPQTFMNKSGVAASAAVASKKAAERLIVLHDELDLPFGTFKISFGKSSGGHRGVESIIRALQTREFTRVRIGISPATPSGKLKKPKGEQKVLDFILGKFSKKEQDVLRATFKKTSDALVMLVAEGRGRAMGEHNR